MESFSTHTDGGMRVCCNSTSSGRIVDNNNNHIVINQITNPLEYFNTDHLTTIRKKMLNGERTPECNNCYAIEDTGGVSVRELFIKQWPLDRVVNNTDLATGKLLKSAVNYLDLSWSNKCNLQCRMCSPSASDQLIKEMKILNIKHGGGNNEWDFKDIWDFNKLKQILDQIVTDNLTDILVTGGEPLINNDFYEFCKMLVSSGISKKINLSFHTNLTVTPTKWIDIWSHFKNVAVKISIDAVEEMYEYIRYPGKWRIIDSNIKELIEYVETTSAISVEFHTIFSIHNTHNFTKLLDYILSLSKSPKVISIPHMNYIYGPDYASPSNLPQEYKLTVTNEIRDWISVNKPFITEVRSIGKLSIIDSMLEIMNNTTASKYDIDYCYEIIKKVDNHRKHDTKMFLPWWDDSLG